MLNDLRWIFLLLLSLFLIGKVSSAEETSPVRNIQIIVEFRTAGVVQQGFSQSTHQSHQTQFLVVSDGMEGRIFVGKKVPQIAWYRDFLQEEGYLKGEVTLRDVGTSLVVRPRIVGDRIEVNLIPEISFETQEGLNTVIEVKNFSTTVLAQDGQALEVGGSLRRSSFEDQFYRTETGEALQIILIPRIL